MPYACVPCHCGSETDDTGTCPYDCTSDWCGRCGADIPRFTEHKCPRIPVSRAQQRREDFLRGQS